MALAYAHGAYLAASHQPQSLEELGAEATLLREVLVADATAQAARGIVSRGVLAQIRSGTGYRDAAFDLLALVNLYRASWSAIEGKTGISLRELELAEILADRLMTAVGVREQAVPTRTVAIDERQRAFTLCVGTYEQFRRAVQYMRFEEADADGLAPSLYSGRTKKPTLDEDPLPEPPLDEPSVDATSIPPASGTETNSIPVGHPGGSPFTE